MMLVFEERYHCTEWINDRHFVYRIASLQICQLATCLASSDIVELYMHVCVPVPMTFLMA